jgi:hypothetical protein
MIDSPSSAAWLWSTASKSRAKTAPAAAMTMNMVPQNSRRKLSQRLHVIIGQYTRVSVSMRARESRVKSPSSVNLPAAERAGVGAVRGCIGEQAWNQPRCKVGESSTRGHLGILRGMGAEADWCAFVCVRAREEGGGRRTRGSRRRRRATCAHRRVRVRGFAGSGEGHPEHETKQFT